MAGPYSSWGIKKQEFRFHEFRKNKIRRGDGGLLGEREDLFVRVIQHQISNELLKKKKHVWVGTRNESRNGKRSTQSYRTSRDRHHDC